MANYKWKDSYSYSNSNLKFQMSRTVKQLIILNICVFGITNIFKSIPWFSVFGFVPSLFLSKFMVWQAFTYMFLHAGLLHLVLNMLMLWFFGPEIEAAWGRKNFLFYYFFTGFGAAIFSFIVSFNSSIPIVGASGALFGILVAYAMMFPENIIIVLIFPMKCKHAVVILTVINLLAAVSSVNNGIAYVAHLGGALFGYMYLKNEKIKRHLLGFKFKKINTKWIDKNIRRRELKEKDLNIKVDDVLDKISKHGMKSLTMNERDILNRKSKGNI
ncbi:MAG: rhomboid family intramembrane serine protease [Candidatus Omnitrophica bacterium]|nr:rhomboid family intramembrane serine protease [Candidatus Omnitrophota bacterium]